MIDLKNILEKRKVMPVISTILLGFILIYAGGGVYKRYTTLKRSVEVKKEELAEFRRLKERYLKEKVNFDYLKRRLLTAGSAESTIAIVESIGEDIGIKERIVSIKPLGERTRNSYLIKEMELKVEGIDLNQLVNLLYRIEHHRMLFRIDEFTMKSRFEKPTLFDVGMKITHITKG